MGREDPQLKLRLTEEMKARITESAKANGRSVNAEIVARLEASEHGVDGDVSELKKALHEEHQSFLRLDDMFTKQMDLVEHYRAIVQRANREVFQQASVIESLSTILLSLEGPPSQDVVSIAEKMLAAAETVKKEFPQSKIQPE